jgi:hypothetical protein
MIKKCGLFVLILLGALELPADARGVTPYLPLNLDPEVESQIERVLILADKPVLTRPIAAATVFDALPKACEVDAELCERVRKFLSHYMQVSGVAFASIEGSASRGSDPVMPNQHGRQEQSHYQLAGAVYAQPADHLLISLGGVAYQGGTAVATGSMISAGFDWAQLDIGYRDHWWSPMTDSAMLISTEAPTMPSITLSNYRPLTRLGLQYEVFVARMSETNQIVLTNGQLTRGYPKFAGLHFGIEPTSGWSLAANRALIFGGGAAGGQSFTDVLNAFFNPSKSQSTGFAGGKPIGKQEASITSQFIFPGAMPFTVYFEYAGNDTSQGKNYLLGKPALLAGIHFPHVGPFDITYEVAEWQETWYIHGPSAVQIGYLDGITNDGRVIGNWFGDQRQFGDAVGGQSNMLRVGWEPPFGGLLQTQFRTLVNQTFAGQYTAVPYRHEYTGSLTYSYPWRGYAIGGQIDAGQDVFGGRFTRLSGFMRYGDALRSAYSGSAGEASSSRRPDGAELFVDVGANANRVTVDLTNVTPKFNTRLAVGPHIGLGARRAVSEHQDLGVRLEADDVNGHALIAVRALDYRYRFFGPLAWNAFLGAARYAAVATPAYGFYLGTGLQWRDVLPAWDLGVDYRYGVKLSRLHDLPTDPQQGSRPDSFYDINSVSFYVSRKF